MSLENLTVDVYISPRELTEGGKQVSERVALLVQEFGANLALPHLRRFQARCSMEGVKPLPAPGMSKPVTYRITINSKSVIAPGSPILVDGSSHLPAESIIGSGYIRCRCRPAGNLIQDIAIHRLGTNQSLSIAKLNTDDPGLKGEDDVSAQKGGDICGELKIHPPFTRHSKTDADSCISGEHFNILKRVLLINPQISIL